MRKTLNLIGLMAVVSLMSSCMSMHSKSTVILNPDMSGKCIYDIKMGTDLAGIMTMPKEDINTGYSGYLGMGAKKGDRDMALALASKLLSSGKIDAWKDVQFGYLKKDTVFFKGTAYFKDISNMAVSMLDSTVKVYKNDKGQMVMEVGDFKPKKDSAISWKKQPSYDSLTNNIYKSIGLSDIMHYYMASLVRGLDISTTYQLPGKIISSSNFVKRNENTVSLSLKDNDLIRLLDSMSSNNNYVGNMYEKYFSSLGMPGKGSAGGESDESYMYDKILYGEAKPVQVVFKSETKMTFDYAKEVAEAKVYYAGFRKSSGIEKYDSLKVIAEKEKELEKVREQGTLVVDSGHSSGNIFLKSLTVSQYSNDMSFIGKLSHSTSAYDAKIKITRVTTDKGVNVTDSVNKHHSYYDSYESYDTSASEHYFTAYLSSSLDSLGYSYTDTISPQNDKVTFNFAADFSKETRFINLEGLIAIDPDNVIPFKIINLYLKPKDDYGLGSWK